ncbi:HET-domain-containing protein [Sarocladium strictum]
MSRSRCGTRFTTDPRAVAAIYQPSQTETRTEPCTSGNHEDRPSKRQRTARPGASRSANSAQGLETDARGPRGSNQGLRLAQSWLQQCHRHHESCRASKPALSSKQPVLPTRLINASNPQSPVLQEMRQSRVPYVAMSYRWGTSANMRTLESNIDVHLAGIPVDTLPRMFIDALHVVRVLGHKYLWIDALCIIQDNPDDLGRELSRMGDIYQNADFTIYASGSANPQIGLFANHDPRVCQPCQLTITTTSGLEPVVEEVTLAATYMYKDVLETRGWILQERVLSTRTIIFNGQIAWRCAFGDAQESDPDFRERPRHLIEPALGALERLRQSILSVGSKEFNTVDHFRLWYAMLEIYSEKDLTSISDNLPALSGLAALFQEAHGASYAAGLWNEDLRRGLAWYVSLNDERGVIDPPCKPSWSFVAVGKVRIRYYLPDESSFTDLGPESLSAKCIPSTSNPYGLTIEGILTVSGWLQKVIIVYDKIFENARIGSAYGRAATSNHPNLGLIDPIVQPRYPALLINPQTKAAVGEAALDRPWPTGSVGASPLGQKHERAAWCLLLSTHHSLGKVRCTLLILDKDEGTGQFSRLGLGFMGEEHMAWFDIPRTQHLATPRNKHINATVQIV